MSVSVTFPVVFAVTFGVVSVSAPIAPDALVNVTELLPAIMPAPVIEPDPVAIRVSAVPETAAPTTMPLLLPELKSVSVPVATTGLVTFIAVAATAESVKLKLAPDDEPLLTIACVSTTVTLPVVLAVRFGAATVSDPIARFRTKGSNCWQKVLRRFA